MVLSEDSPLKVMGYIDYDSLGQMLFRNEKGKRLDKKSMPSYKSTLKLKSMTSRSERSICTKSDEEIAKELAGVMKTPP